MDLPSTDVLVVHWAVGRGYACCYGRAKEGLGQWLKVRLDHAVAFFHHGRLVKLDCRSDGRRTHELANELAELFVLCGYVDAQMRSVRLEQLVAIAGGTPAAGQEERLGVRAKSWSYRAGRA